MQSTGYSSAAPQGGQSPVLRSARTSTNGKFLTLQRRIAVVLTISSSVGEPANPAASASTDAFKKLLTGPGSGQMNLRAVCLVSRAGNTFGSSPVHKCLAALFSCLPTRGPDHIAGGGLEIS